MLPMDTEQLRELSQVRSLVSTGAARSIRLGAQLSLSEIATAVGVSVSTVCRWELGERVPRGAAALKYGDVLETLMGPKVRR